MLYDGPALHAQQECGVCACMNACLGALKHQRTVLHTWVRFSLLIIVIVYQLMLLSAASSHGMASR